MRILRSQILPTTPFDYFSDGTAIFVPVPVKSGMTLLGYNPDTLERIAKFQMHPVPLVPIFRTAMEQIFYISQSGVVGIDSFNGSVLTRIDLGSCVPVSFDIHDGLMYSLCGVPLINGKKYGFESFCICVNNLETGAKLRQSQTVVGHYSSMVIDDSIWVSIGDSVYKFSKDMELSTKTKSKVTSKFPICLTSRYVVVASDMGSAHMFDRKTLTEAGRFILRKTSNTPLDCGNDSIAWVCKDSCSRIDLNSMELTTVKMERNALTDACVLRNHLVVGDESGSLVKINLGQMDLEQLNLHDSTIWKPRVMSDSLMLVSQSHLYKIEV